MQSLKALWKTDKLHTIIILYFIFAYSWIYRVALRTLMDGSDFRWANTINTEVWGEARKVYIYGSGTDGHFIIILLLALFFCIILFSLLRRPDYLAKILLLGWVSIFTLWQITISVGLGTDHTISGDTFGVVLPYYIIGPAEQILLLILCLFWIIRNKTKYLFFPSLSSQSKKELLYILLTLPVTFLLLRFGEQNGTTDQIGVIILYVQLFAFVITFLSIKRSEVDDEIS
ncbi:MAG: hypothetical protein ROO71_02890 [Balneola sp.]